jgi:hypothetical protein
MQSFDVDFVVAAAVSGGRVTPKKKNQSAAEDSGGYNACQPLAQL